MLVISFCSYTFFDIFRIYFSFLTATCTVCVTIMKLKSIMSFNIFLEMNFFSFFPTVTLPPFIYTLSRKRYVIIIILYYIQRVGVVCPHVNTRYAHLRAAKSKTYRNTPPKRYVPRTLLPANRVVRAFFIHRIGEIRI